MVKRINMKRILINDYAGHPFQLDLSIQLAELGHEVFHLYSSSAGGPKAGFDREIKNLKIINVNIGDIEKLNFVKRFFQEISYGKELVKKVNVIQPDVIVSANTPIPAQFLLSRWANKNSVKFIFWLQDIISIAAISLLSKKIPIIGGVIGKLMNYVERYSLRNSDAIVCSCDDFKLILEKWNITDNVHVIPNWAPIEEMPIHPKDNHWSRLHNIENKFVILYSGTMGMKHNPNVITDAAEKLKGNTDIVFVVVSEGAGADYIKNKAKQRNLNILILPFQEFSILPKVLASSDILLTVLEKDAGIFSVPSKVWSYYCAARASFLCVPEDNLAARITIQNKAGIVFQDNQDFIEMINYFNKNSDELTDFGVRARRYAENNFDIEKITCKFENIII